MRMVGLDMLDLGIFKSVMCFTMVVLIFTPVAAQDWEKASTAYESGDFAKAVEELRPLVEANDAASALAANLLGRLYEAGDGVPKDYAQAISYYRLAAEKGLDVGQHNLGVMYDKVLQNYKEAVKWYRLAAEQNNAESQYNLGSMYLNGLGVVQDSKEAVSWLRLAAGQGLAAAQSNLGILYQEGNGVLQNYEESVGWFRLAAVQGNAIAQSNLGVVYEYGEGVLQDNVMAHMWYNIASANGHKKSVGYRDERTAVMTSEDISTAQAMARECMSSGYITCGY